MTVTASHEEIRLVITGSPQCSLIEKLDCIAQGEWAREGEISTRAGLYIAAQSDVKLRALLTRVAAG
jgi:hypothetical protein